jgi:tetratricopeptide (TPR) repeat protein
MSNPEPHHELEVLLSQLKELGYCDLQEDQLAASQERVIEWNRFNLARSLLEGGCVAEAIEILVALAAKPSASLGVILLVLESYLLAGRLDDAQRTIEQLRPPLAEKAFISLTLGRIELARRRPRAALDLFRRAAELDSTNVRVYVFSGQAHLDLRQWPQARSAFERALGLDANHPEALYGLSLVCLRGDDARAAATFAVDAIEGNPWLPGAHFLLGVALQRLGRNQEAASELERALHLDPSLRAARRVLMRLYSSLGNLEQAAEHGRWNERLRRQRRTLPGE